ncbi:MAG: GNAT family N-acetyltransferase [Deltaproteobacteria bacterium]|jgi:RimJ/RimL family protein N-acetyltransferase|nr:GNAT family N-acetyltransferase [Deltaproteobacteria bacterium]
MTDQKISSITPLLLEGKLVRLRALQESDIDKCLAFINDQEVRAFTGASYPFPFSYEEQMEWIRSQKSNFAKGCYTFAIDALKPKPSTEDDSLGRGACYIGNCGINVFNNVSRVALISITIGDKNYWGSGYGTEALQLFLKFIFLGLNAQKIELCVNDFNERAIACYKKLGFVEEGRLRRSRFVCGKYCDIVRMGLLFEEWQQQ